MVTNGEAFIKGLVMMMINDVVLFLNVGKTMDQYQVQQTAEMIVVDFYYLKVEDFKLCFNNAKRGYYGKQYDRIDGQVIYEWLGAYTTEREEEAMRLNKEALPASEPNPEGQKKVIEILKGVLDNVTPEKKYIDKELITPAPEKVDQTTKFFQDCFAEFDSEYKRAPVKTGGSSRRFILYNGKALDEEEYTRARLKDHMKALEEESKIIE